MGEVGSVVLYGQYVVDNAFICFDHHDVERDLRLREVDFGNPEEQGVLRVEKFDGLTVHALTDEERLEVLWLDR